MNRPTLVLAPLGALLLALAVPACGPGDSGSLGTLPTEPPAASPSPTADPSPPASPATRAPSPSPSAPRSGGGTPETGAPPATRSLTIAVWFTRGGELFPTSRTRPATVATSRLALTELMAGPSSQERNAGVRNGVPADLDFDASIAGGVATLDLPASFYSGGRNAARLRQAQVVYTLTQFLTVSTVGFQSDGEPVGWPVGRSDYADLLPEIVVTSPGIGQRVPSPVTVTGTANVFEATVSLRILDASGAEIATTFTTATCGSGCRGDYTVAVPYRVTTEQRGTLQVFQVSAEDGSRISVVDIPVTLVPR